METVNASYFKTHFGEVLGRSSRQAVRITRRGHASAVLLPETEYDQLRERAARPSAAETEALSRLRKLAGTMPRSLEKLAHDSRAQAILAKHGPKRKEE